MNIKAFLFLALIGFQSTAFSQKADPGTKNMIPSMDELAGSWQTAADLRCLPAINSMQGSAQTLKDVLSVGKLSYPPVTMTGQTGSLLLNGKSLNTTETRWFPYQVDRKASLGNIAVETSVRMVFEKRGLLFKIVLTNTGSAKEDVDLRVNLSAKTSSHKNWGWKIPRDVAINRFKAVLEDKGRTLLMQDTKGELANCFSFEKKPGELVALGDSGQARWKVSLAPKSSYTVNYVLSFGQKDKEVRMLAVKWAERFNKTFQQVKTDWQKRFDAMFTPGNKYFSGSLPVLRTGDEKLRRMYYMSIMSVLSVLRTSFPVAPRVYVSNTPESNVTMMYFWDTREWATVLALLDPQMMKQYLRSWLGKGIYNGYAEEYLTGTLQGPWYSANDYSVFVLLNDYLNVTKDRAFLAEKIQGKSVLEHMDSIATNWKKLVLPGHTLADYGGIENLLECVPTYIHEVPSFNAANVWMMKRVSELYEAEGNKTRSFELKVDAAKLLNAVLKLYVPGQGVWNALHKDGSKVEVRHVYDYATIGLTIPNELTESMKQEMTAFVERELLTDHWMRAQSLSDIAANVSDRPDHGPMGAFCAWPSETMGAMSEFKMFDKALDFMHRCTETTYEGPFSQSRELMDRTFHAPVKINERGSGGFPTQTYNASNGGGFAETIIKYFFGFKPNITGNSALRDPEARGFSGELLNVRLDGKLCNIRSTEKGLVVEK